MKDRISVIVPVYNVARYLPECIDSILDQDYKDLEVILIDDGSTDLSGTICDQYAQKDLRVTVIHQKNGGAAAAKNAGLRAARGEYLSFVDSDDVLEPGAYSHMLAILRESDADAVECSFRDLYRDGKEDQILISERQVFDRNGYLTQFTKGWTCALLWNKLYKRALFEGVFFEEGHKIDDEYFTYQGFLKAKKVIRDGRIVYNYRRRASSVMQSPSAREQRLLDRIDAMTKRREKVVSAVPQLRKTFDTEYMDALVYMAEYPENTRKTLAVLKEKLRDYLFTPGNTLPPKRFLRGMVALLLMPSDKLLAKIQPEPEADKSRYYP